MTRARRCLGAVLLTAAVCAGCTSPEAQRTRGGGPGADAGNRSATVRMHGGSDPFWNTPVHIDNAYPALEPATQARQFGQP